MQKDKLLYALMKEYVREGQDGKNRVREIYDSVFGSITTNSQNLFSYKVCKPGYFELTTGHTDPREDGKGYFSLWTHRGRIYFVRTGLYSVEIRYESTPPYFVNRIDQLLFRDVSIGLPALISRLKNTGFIKDCQ